MIMLSCMTFSKAVDDDIFLNDDVVLVNVTDDDIKSNIDVLLLALVVDFTTYNIMMIFG
jgi:hypothetical protein